ncbi:hypothetical protein ACOME3_004934, partial [Neoechinorhynchus agilis]
NRCLRLRVNLTVMRFLYLTFFLVIVAQLNARRDPDTTGTSLSKTKASRKTKSSSIGDKATTKPAKKPSVKKPPAKKPTPEFSKKTESKKAANTSPNVVINESKPKKTTTSAPLKAKKLARKMVTEPVETIEKTKQQSFGSDSDESNGPLTFLELQNEVDKFCLPYIKTLDCSEQDGKQNAYGRGNDNQNQEESVIEQTFQIGPNLIADDPSVVWANDFIQEPVSFYQIIPRFY